VVLTDQPTTVPRLTASGGIPLPTFCVITECKGHPYPCSVPLIIVFGTPAFRCTRWRSWLRHCATGRKVAVSIPVGRTMALGLNQPLTEMGTRNISWGGIGGRCEGLITLPPSCADCFEIWEPQTPVTLRACPDLYWDCFTFFLYIGFYIHTSAGLHVSADVAEG